MAVDDYTSLMVLVALGTSLFNLDTSVAFLTPILGCSLIDISCAAKAAKQRKET